LNIQPVNRAVGCPRCGNSGYRGRLPLVEVAVVTPSMSDQIAAGSSTTALQRSAVVGGMATLRDVAIARVRRGETTLQELERVLGEALQDSPGSIGPPTILLVHDDPSWRRAARALLEGGGFRVVEVPDRATAFQHIAAGEHFELVLTDTGIDSTDMTLAQRLHGRTDALGGGMASLLGLPAGLRVKTEG
jgi:PleD family two-component response regulator